MAIVFSFVFLDKIGFCLLLKHIGGFYEKKETVPLLQE